MRKAQGVVWTNGCFDLLGPHHVDFLNRARLLGNQLWVGLNSDASVRRIKGPGRPIYRQEQRREVLLGLRSVDAVWVFDSEEELGELIRLFRPAALVKGKDYAGRPITGSQYVGRVELLAFNLEMSTSQTIARIRADDVA
jgi:rfaE bifunctional protein nucleotidyltransferase chain/domain